LTQTYIFIGTISYTTGKQGFFLGAILFTPGIKTKLEDRTQENMNPNIRKTEFPNYISGRKFQNLNIIQVFLGNN
jgi:hypothetical protein